MYQQLLGPNYFDNLNQDLDTTEGVNCKNRCCIAIMPNLCTWHKRNADNSDLKHCNLHEKICALSQIVVEYSFHYFGNFCTHVNE